MDRSKTIRQTIFIVVLLSAVTVAAYWGVLDHQFINYDEPDYVTDNPHVLTGLTPAKVAWAFTGGHAGNWHPLTWLSHMLDCQLYGTKPFGHHLTNLILHIVNTILLFLLLRLTTAAAWPSAFAAALFALHPLHVESVAWVAERKDVLSTFFGLLSLLAYARYAQGKSDAHPSPALPPKKITAPHTQRTALCYFLAVLSLALGLMSKPMLVTMPVLLLLLDFWPLRRKTSVSKLLVEKIPFFLLSIGSSIVTFIVQQSAGAMSSLEALSPEFRISNALISYIRYIFKMIWPQNLAVFYPVPVPAEWPLELVLGAGLLLASVSFFSIKWAKRTPYFFVGWWWYVVSLTPVIGIIQVGQQAMADRYSYIPLVGLFVAMVWAISELQARLSLNIGLVAGTGLALLAICTVLTWQQSAYWQTTTTLFEHAIAATGDNSVAQNNLGVSLQDAGDLSGAEAHFVEALRIKPRYVDALGNLAICREKQGRRAEAIELLQKALEIKPTAVTHYDTAKMFAEQGDLAHAEEHYRQAIQLKPDFVKARYNLGVLLARQGRNDDAVQQYQEALRLASDFTDIHASLGSVLVAQGKLDEAIAEFNAAIKTSPDSADAHYNLATALKAKGDIPGAAAHYAETCRLRPEDAEARENLGFTLLVAGKATEAISQFEQVIQTHPSARAHYYLGLALDGLGKSADAMPHYREAVRLEPNAPLYLNDLAWALATNPDGSLRNGPEAIELAQRACQLSGGKAAQFWGTLDAAYAEAGRFNEAMATAKKTREMALAAGQDEIARRAEERLALYQAQKPYRPPQQARAGTE